MYKALSLIQPWATLVAVGAKRFETRSWSTPYRGPLVIHASQTLDGSMFCHPTPVSVSDHFAEALALHGCPLDTSNVDGRRFAGMGGLPRGHALAVCRLVDVYPTEDVRRRISDAEKAFGNYANGRFAWALADVKVFPKPLPMTGSLSVFTIPRAKASADNVAKDAAVCELVSRLLAPVAPAAEVA